MDGVKKIKGEAIENRFEAKMREKDKITTPGEKQGEIEELLDLDAVSQPFRVYECRCCDPPYTSYLSDKGKKEMDNHEASKGASKRTRGQRRKTSWRRKKKEAGG